MNSLLRAIILSTSSLAAASASADIHLWPLPAGLPGAPSGPGLGTVAFTNGPHAPGNDDVPGMETAGHIQGQKNFAANGYIDTPGVANVLNIAAGYVGPSEYNVREFVTNNTGVAWSSFIMQIHSVNASGTPLPLIDFDISNMFPAPASNIFTAVSHTASTLIFSGGTVLPGQTVLFQFQMDDLITNPDVNNDGGVDMADVVFFTLREEPKPIPAPGAAALALIGSGLVAARRRR